MAQNGKYSNEAFKESILNILATHEDQKSISIAIVKLITEELMSRTKLDSLVSRIKKTSLEFVITLEILG